MQLSTTARNDLVGPVVDPFCPLLVMLLCKAPSEAWVKQRLRGYLTVPLG